MTRHTVQSTKALPLKLINSNLIFPLLVFVSTFSISACSTTLNANMPVPGVKSPSEVSRRAGIDGSFLFVEEFTDTRTSTELVRYEGKTTQPIGSVGAPVTTAMRQAFSRAGFSIADSAPLIISGEVRTWNADISGSMPSRMETKASLYIEVFDPANKRIYYGTYNGQAMLQDSSLSEEEMSFTLSDAMTEAVAQVLRDDRLMNLLASF